MIEGVAMKFAERHLQVLQDIYRYSRIERYHGMLPQRLTYAYDDGVLPELMEMGLVEEGVILTRCGSNPIGFRLSEKGKQDLKDNGIDLLNVEWERFRQDESVDLDGLSEEDLDVLMDIYYLTKTKKYNGIAPRHLLEDYGRPRLEFLYDAGLILYIKLKGKNVQREKGYVLSERATTLLRRSGIS